MAMERQRKVRWGELDDGDAGGGGLDFLRPPPVVIVPDEGGLKKVIEYRFDGDGNRVRVTTTTRVRRLARARLSRAAVERRSWPTMVSTEEIFLERPRAAVGSNDKAASGDLPDKNAKGTLLMVCRTCGKKGDHWTSKCPYKDLAAPPEKFPDTNDAEAQGGAGKGGAYVPPVRRDGGDTSGADVMRIRNDENAVRVNNLGEDTREPDLLELFSPFGPVSRVSVVVDRHTGASRGFGFVNFVRREDGEKAISKLDGYGYDNLILRV